MWQKRLPSEAYRVVVVVLLPLRNPFNVRNYEQRGESLIENEIVSFYVHLNTKVGRWKARRCRFLFCQSKHCRSKRGLDVPSVAFRPVECHRVQEVGSRRSFVCSLMFRSKKKPENYSWKIHRMDLLVFFYALVREGGEEYLERLDGCEFDNF